MTEAEKAVRTAHDQDNIKYLNGACNFKNIGALLAELDSLRKDAESATPPLTDEQAAALGKVALEKWNAQADEYNHWDNLGLDEMSLLITREVEAAHGITPAGGAVND